MLEFLRRQLAALVEERAQLQQQLEATLDAPTRESRNLTAAEQRDFDRCAAAVDSHDARIEEMRARVAEAEGRADRATLSAQHAVASGTTGPDYVPGWGTYQRGGPYSYFRDLIVGTRDRDPAALDRLDRHAREVRAGMTTVDGAGGYFVPPEWLLAAYGEVARGGRVTADLCAKLDLPKTDSVSIPKLSSGSSVALQAGQGTPVTQVDPVDASVTSPVVTLAGQVLLSQQLWDQSPLAFDQILMQDLAAAHAVAVDQQVLSGSGTNGNLTGLLTVSGTNAVTYTDTTPTLSELWPKVAAAVQAVYSGVFLPPDAIVMHPRRWAWCLAATDTGGRPLIVPDTSGPTNTMGQAAAPAALGRVGTIQGVPTYTDPNVPTNLGAGTNEDVILVLRRSEVFLLEGPPVVRVLDQAYAGNLQVAVQLYRYAAFIGNRRPAAISVISGTGLVAPVL